LLCAMAARSYLARRAFLHRAYFSAHALADDLRLLYRRRPYGICDGRRPVTGGLLHGSEARFHGSEARFRRILHGHHGLTHVMELVAYVRQIDARRQVLERGVHVLSGDFQGGQTDLCRLGRACRHRLRRRPPRVRSCSWPTRPDPACSTAWRWLLTASRLLLRSASETPAPSFSSSPWTLLRTSLASSLADSLAGFVLGGQGELHGLVDVGHGAKLRRALCRQTKVSSSTKLPRVREHSGSSERCHWYEGECACPAPDVEQRIPPATASV
jgi:hypothetical protein